MKPWPVPPTQRPTCGRCLRPTSVCYCAALTTIDTRTRVVILQHPRERRMPIGTARMAALCLPKATLHVGVRWDDDPAFRAAVSDPERPPALLYPGPSARDVLAEPPAGPVTLIVVDGTWSQAKTVVRDNPSLQALPRFAFAAPEPSRYAGVRREPREDYVSTIEALMHVLGALEGDAARFRALLAPMRAMLDAHLAAQARAPRERTYRPRVDRREAVRLRQARKADAAALAVVLRSAVRDAMPWLPELHTPKEDVRHLRHVVRAHEVWVAEIDGRPVGFASLGRSGDEPFLQHLYVAPDRQGRGVGAALFARAKSRRPHGFQWWVFQRNERARRFYERRGAVLVRTTDGAGNEEKTPDVLYAWRPSAAR